MAAPTSRAHRGRKLASAAAGRATQAFVHGVALLVDGGLTRVGDTPRDRVLRDGKLEVFRYRPRARDEIELGAETLLVEPPAHRVPVLLVPPLMVRPYIYDLRAEHSMVRTLRDAGLDVFLVDFGVPDAKDAGLRIDDYVLRFLPAALAAVRRASGQPDVSIVGYCMGGIFGLLYTAAFADPHVRNLVTIASPIDFSQMGLLTFVARVAASQAGLLADRIGNIPGGLNSQAVQMLRPVKRVTRWADLFMNLWNEEYVRGFESMYRWTNDFIPYPRDAFKQVMKDLFRKNRLVRGMRVGDRVADLRRIQCPLLAFAGAEDRIATPASVLAIRQRVGSRDVTLVEAPGGHLGVVAGRGARRAVWERTARWLTPRSG